MTVDFNVVIANEFVQRKCYTNYLGIISLINISDGIMKFQIKYTVFILSRLNKIAWKSANIIQYHTIIENILI